MSWATFWSWTCWTASWCFFTAAVVFVIQWWTGFKMHDAKLRFLEMKIDALLDELEVDFDERLAEQMSTILDERGQRKAAVCYMATAGVTPSEAENYVERLIEKQQSTEDDDSEDDDPEDDDPEDNDPEDAIQQRFERRFRHRPLEGNSPRCGGGRVARRRSAQDARRCGRRNVRRPAASQRGRRRR